MDEELNKYMKDRMDEAVDNLVGQGVDNVDKKVDKQIIWGYIYDLLERKQTTMRPMLLWTLQFECFKDTLKMLKNQINATWVIMNVQIWVLWGITYLFTGSRCSRCPVYEPRPL